MSRPERHPPPTAGLTELVLSAAEGDQAAWDALVDRFAGLVWSIARAHRLSAADAADVSQTTWLRLVEHLGRIRDPERVGAWLAATARHECLRVIRHAGRFIADGDVDLDAVGTEPEPSTLLLATERTAALWRAVEALPERCRTLIRALMADPAPSYEDIAAAFDIPIGSIGPTRARCLDQLKRRPEIAGIS
jgi:RNA polymerase sigma factor (sigma-70 family)